MHTDKVGDGSQKSFLSFLWLRCAHQHQRRKLKASHWATSYILRDICSQCDTLVTWLVCFDGHVSFGFLSLLKLFPLFNVGGHKVLLQNIPGYQLL